MKRSAMLLISCVAIAGSAWLVHSVWAQSTEPKEKTFTITQSQLDKYVAKKVAEAVAADREKVPGDKDKAATDEQVLNPQNWHKAIFNQAEYVIYTGPGSLMFHHWVASAPKPVATKGTTAKTGVATVPSKDE